MYPYIETIKVLNGKAENLRFHQARYVRTRAEMLGLKDHPLLADEIKIPGHARKGLFKCRVLYDEKEIRVEFHPHVRPVIRSLKLVSGDHINYPYKSADRSALTDLFNQRGSCDDILILKKGWITDSYYANAVFWDGAYWYTPEEPLLKGTMRASLLEKGIIKAAGIRLGDLSQFSNLRLINALNNWNDAPIIPLEAVTL